METTGSRYQRDTAYVRGRIPSGGMEWGNQPSVFREYPGQPLTVLPEGFSLPDRSLGEVLKGSVLPRHAGVLRLEEAAAALYLAAGITAHARHAGRVFYFRAAPSAGALYPVEVYCAVQGVEGVEDGLYHFTLSRFGLTRLRRGDVQEYVNRYLLRDRDCRDSWACFLLSTVFFRSAWKYGKRAYRYALLDCGHLLENLVSALQVMEIPAHVYLDFRDAEANRFIGADGEEEAVMAVVCAARGEVRGETGSVGPVDGLDVKPTPVAPRPRVFQEIAAVHRGTGVASFVEKSKAREISSPSSDPPGDGMDVPGGMGADTPSFAETVRVRRSKRNYMDERIPESVFGELLRMVFPVPAPDRYSDPRPKAGVVVGGVQGVFPGFYWIDPLGERMKRVREGDLRASLARAALDQMWLGRCSLIFVFWADLEETERRYGVRAYRHVMIKAGGMGQRIYLAATALNMGCCGIGAFYDEEVGEVLGLGASESPLYLLGVGPVKK